MRPKIRYEAIKARDLPAFAEDQIARGGPGKFVPITGQRAIAMAHNPLADDDTVGLIAAFDGDQCVGYFGVMPVLLKHGEERAAVQWFTTWLAHPDYLGQGIGSGLMQAALDLGQDYMIVGSAPARRVCRKFGFHELPEYPYAVVDFGLTGRYNPVALSLRALRKLLHLLGFKLDIANVNAPVARFFDAVFGPVLKPMLYLTLSLGRRHALAVLTIKQVEQVRAEPVPAWPRTGLVRDAAAINWMLACPWVVEPGQSPTGHMSYYFSDVRPRFEQIALEIFRGDDYQGFAVFQLSGSEMDGKLTLKVLDHALPDQSIILPLALDLARKERVDIIEMDWDLAGPLRDSLLGRLLVRKKVRVTQCLPYSDDSPLGRAWREITPTFVDGDLPFS